MTPARSVGLRLLYVLLAVFAVALAAAPSSQAAACTPPVVNDVACENTLPGADPDTWQIQGAGDRSIQGFATSMSVNKGGTISFKIKSATPGYHIDILRLGYYGGDGARVMKSNLLPTGPSTQDPCLTNSATGLVDCGNWSVSASWTVPSTAVSGVYIAHLVRDDTGGDSHITFVVRDDASDADIVVQTSDTTWQAYNTYGGNSTYRCEDCPPGNPRTYKGAYKVSYNRPVTTEEDSPPSALFEGAEYNMIRFLEASGYDVSYISGVDTHARGQLLTNHKLFISSGHDEYWSAGQRANVEAARDAGVNLAFFSGNEMFWKHRWEPSMDASATPNRTLVTYKDTHFDLEEEQDPVAWTGTWRDPRFGGPEEGVKPENALTGQSFAVNSGTSRITVPAAYGRLRMWRNTAAASLGSTQTLALAPETLGYEWDEDADNGFRPAGQFRLSSTTVSGVEIFTDYGSTTAMNQTTTHNLTMYRAASGARVFGAGTVQWAWGLDDWRRDGLPADRNMQQATVNLLADMGAQPATRLAGLFAASASTDTTRPTATLSTPPATVADGAVVTLSGAAADTGGVVAGVEVSTDGGATWHLATGTTSWTYRWIAHGSPSATIRVRATDDSGNLQTPGPGVSVGVSCPCSVWGPNVAPLAADASDPAPIEVGMKFKSDAYGTITGLRFHKSAGNTGTHTGSLWTADGQRLAQATFQNETASGWQSVTFDAPVTIQPGTTYVASYHAPNGHYTGTPGYFYRAPAPGPNGGAIIDSGPLHWLRNSGAAGNGVFAYSGTSTFPTRSYEAANYWVDVVFSPIPAPGQVTGVSATEGGRTSANVSWTAPAGGGNVTAYRITPYIGSTAQTAKAVTVSAPVTSGTVAGLTQGTTYTFRVAAVNPTGPGPESAPSNAVTPNAPVAPAPPTGVDARAASQSARVTWTAPGADGDSPITGYTVTPYLSGAAQTPVQAGPAATSATVSGLTNGESYSFRVTATNAVGTSPASASSAAVTPQATIFDFAAPSSADGGDADAVELGVKFRAEHDGKITGIRFYKSAANTGIHTGSLWSAGGQRLTQATFTNETDSGWQSVTFATPVDVTAGTTYVASYFAPQGHYSVTPNGLGAAIDNGPLRALGDATSANGVYAYGAASSFPDKSWNAANYWVDVLFALPKRGGVTGVSAAEGGPTSANVAWTAPTTGGPVTSYRVTPYVGSTPQAPRTVTGATNARIGGLTTGTTYTFTVRAVNANGAGPESARSAAVTPVAAVAPSAPTDVLARPATRSARVTWTAPATDGDSPITGYKVTPYVGAQAQTPVQAGPSATSATVAGLDNGVTYTFRVTATNAVGDSPAGSSNAVTPQGTIFDFATPGQPDSGDPDRLEVGVKFRTTVAGFVTGIRFYKAAANTGTHTGSLWNASGGRIAQVTFTGESASGWQTAVFDTPVQITPNTTYVASYFAPDGHYSITSQGFTSRVLNPPLEALANGTSPNGVYAYGAASTFPASSWGASNYWVDVLFAADAAIRPAAPGNVAAQGDSKAAIVRWTAPDDGGSEITGYTVTPYIGATAQPAVQVGAGATSARIGALANGTAYTFRVSATNAVGTSADSAASNAVTPGASIFESATPATVDVDDPGPVNLGVKFRSSVAGRVTGIRFYKSEANTGTHVGSLWAEGGGAPLAQASFSGETNTGWQAVTFDTPVDIAADTTYVASYLAPNGHYSITSAAFASNGIENPPLRALAQATSANGVFAYGGTSTFPTSSFNSGNYWVDVLFVPGS